MNNCPICSEQFNNDSLLHFQYVQQTYVLLKCPNCECLFFNNSFEFDFRHNEDHNKGLRTYLEKNVDIESLVTLVYNFLSQLPQAEKGVDIGCGAGLAMDIATTLLNKTMIGFEPSLNYRLEGTGKLNLNIIDDFFSVSYLQGNQQHYAICLQVLQLCNSPLTLLQDTYSILNQDGILLLSTPNNPTISSWNDIRDNIAALSPGINRVLFGEKSLTIALKCAGFKHVKIYNKDNVLFALASANELADIELFIPKREILIQYYELKLSTLEKNSSYYKGIWYRYFRYKVDHGEYESALLLLQEANWFEAWSESEIEGIDSHESLFQLNTFSDAIIYYYIGILFLNYLRKTGIAEKFFLLSYLLSKRIIEIQQDNCSLESDIIWLAKLNYSIAKMNRGHYAEAKIELTALVTGHRLFEKLPIPSLQIKNTAQALLKSIV